MGIALFYATAPREYDSSDKPRLPYLLRQALDKHGINVYNPRGQLLFEVQSVAKLCGLILECLDPNGSIRGQSTCESVFASWCKTAKNFYFSNPSLRSFITSWQNRPSPPNSSWPDQMNVIQLVYKLLHWIPNLQNSVGGLAYLEFICRTVTEEAYFSKYKGHILFKDRDIEMQSIITFIEYVLEPIASGNVDLDEELLETLPQNRFNILSIHQSKGLEFPMVIVEIGSDLKSAHHMQAPKRFPRCGELTHNLEDGLRPYSTLGAPSRPARDRAFDDLTRLYYVAYSQAQDVLLLVGLNGVLSKIPCVAAGWTRNSQCNWQNLPNLIHI